MTKERAALPLSVVAEQNPFFTAWVGRRHITSPVEMTKGRVVPPGTVVAGQGPLFISSGEQKARDFLLY
jgi:hypothetical protein